MPQFHSTRPRGFDLAPQSVFLEGRFGRMFRSLPAFEPPVEALDVLAETMREDPPAAPGGDGWEPSRDEGDSPIPAGFTYLGQFIDHDITFDPVSSLQRQNDPDGLQNFRTPRFDLDSLYGRGPNNDPFMYDPAISDGRSALLVGSNDAGDRDLPRNSLPLLANGDPQGRALIGDPRNDENIIVGQLHLLFLRFHNKVLELLEAGDPRLASAPRGFEGAQQVVRWHYQWIVVHDFLRRIVGDEVATAMFRAESFILPGGNQVDRPAADPAFYGWQRGPFMPVEFSVAAYRFGHSMLRPSYKINEVVPELPLFSEDPNAGQLSAFHGFRPLPQGWTIDWAFFFETGDGSRLQMARKIDSKLSAPTFTLPDVDPPVELAKRNLQRGRAIGLPTGQAVARTMGIDPLDDAQLGAVNVSDVFVGAAPLWFYTLKEAEVLGEGARLGPVGGRIVADVLVGLLDGDPLSYLNVEPRWRPPLGEGGDFTVANLIELVG